VTKKSLAKRTFTRAILTRSLPRDLFCFHNFPQISPNQKNDLPTKNHLEKSWREILGKTHTNATEFQCMRFPNSPQTKYCWQTPAGLIFAGSSACRLAGLIFAARRLDLRGLPRLPA
jgi:hypothetical protein